MFSLKDGKFEKITCDECEGDGTRIVRRSDGGGLRVSPCRECDGKGEVDNPAVKEDSKSES